MINEAKKESIEYDLYLERQAEAQQADFEEQSDDEFVEQVDRMMIEGEPIDAHLEAVYEDRTDLEHMGNQEF